jgi:hypothetical protein
MLPFMARQNNQASWKSFLRFSQSAGRPSLLREMKLSLHSIEVEHSIHRPVLSTVFTEEWTMTKLKILGAACVSLALVATPALARPGGGWGHGGGAHFSGGGAHFAGGHFHGGGFRGGFGPGIAAGVIAGAALGGYGYYNGYGPGYGDSYAYDDSYSPGYDNGYAVGPGYAASPGYVTGPAYDNGYARRNGFVCQPGTLFRGEDGRTHLCQ